jgi:hypothetical protein
VKKSGGGGGMNKRVEFTVNGRVAFCSILRIQEVEELLYIDLFIR